MAITLFLFPFLSILVCLLLVYFSSLFSHLLSSAPCRRVFWRYFFFHNFLNFFPHPAFFSHPNRTTCFFVSHQLRTTKLRAELCLLLFSCLVILVCFFRRYLRRTPIQHFFKELHRFVRVQKIPVTRWLDFSDSLPFHFFFTHLFLLYLLEFSWFFQSRRDVIIIFACPFRQRRPCARLYPPCAEHCTLSMHSIALSFLFSHWLERYMHRKQRWDRLTSDRGRTFFSLASDERFFHGDKSASILWLGKKCISMGQNWYLR